MLHQYHNILEFDLIVKCRKSPALLHKGYSGKPISNASQLIEAEATDEQEKDEHVNQSENYDRPSKKTSIESRPVRM